MDKTRVRILNEIDAWIKDPDVQRICWIAGMAGTGKTSIAKTVCKRASSDPDIMLGGSFFCPRTGIAAQREIRCVVPTLVQLLARQSVEFSLALADEIARDNDLQHKHVAVQIEKLLHAPLLALKNSPRTVVFVVDALDECGGETASSDEESHQAVSEMLEALVTSSFSSAKLSIKFLVTSRPEVHVRETPVSSADFTQILRLHAVNKQEVDADIHRYITATLTTKLSDKPTIRAKFTETVVEDLVQICGGLFIVAATALKHTFGAGALAVEARFNKLLNDSRDGLNARAAAPLDRMYQSILEEAVGEDQSGSLLQLLASILAARMTLSVAAIADLLAQEPSDVRESLSQLHAVVNVPDDNDAPDVRTVHASFGDYLFGRAPDGMRISRALGHDNLAHACLKLMDKLLFFNVSKSASSYEANSASKSDSIRLSLQYACMHWAHHIAVFRLSDNISSKASTFDLAIGSLFRPKLLSWLEVLSVLNKIGLASGLLMIAGSIVSPVSLLTVNLLTLPQVNDPIVSQFLRDASSFVASSHEAIERSAPHIYLSALPFADKDSLVYKEFASRFTGLIAVDIFGIQHHGGGTIMTLTGHDGAVRSVSYSSDGRMLASGSDDGTVRIWNTQTGEEAISSMSSGDGKVLSIDFSDNNKWVASGTESGAVWVWNVMPGQASRRKLSGHSSAVNSVAFSPDSSCLASASGDGTVRLWNADRGEQLVSLSDHADSVNGVAFSPDGGILASISDDGTVMLWHSKTRQAVCKPLLYRTQKRPICHCAASRASQLILVIQSQLNTLYLTVYEAVLTVCGNCGYNEVTEGNGHNPRSGQFRRSVTRL